ncbi:MAG TPA: hypothetical protein VM537_08050 [Anaerolineae bacterium]|nr:hypothetical protein [Anaerolineae bacterium]
MAELELMALEMSIDRIKTGDYGEGVSVAERYIQGLMAEGHGRHWAAVQLQQRLAEMAERLAQLNPGWPMTTHRAEAARLLARVA